MNKWCFLVFIFGALSGGILSQREGPNKEESRENPHFNAGLCGDCHGRALPERAGAFGGLKSLYNSLCRSCHAAKPKVCSFHSDRLQGSSREGAPALVPPLFPRQGEKIFCLTCHDARIQCQPARDGGAEGNRSFLRGGPKGGPARFCFACHQAERFKAFKVHEGRSGPDEEPGEACLFCHGELPLAGEGKKKPALRGGPTKTCLVCHRKKDHPGGSDHLVPVESLEKGSAALVTDPSGKVWVQKQGQPDPERLPLGSGKAMECATCHDPHGAAGEGRKLLRMARKGLCAFCHGEAFEAGTPK